MFEVHLKYSFTACTISVCKRVYLIMPFRCCKVSVTIPYCNSWAVLSENDTTIDLYLLMNFCWILYMLEIHVCFLLFLLRSKNYKPQNSQETRIFPTSLCIHYNIAQHRTKWLSTCNITNHENAQ